MYFKVNYPFKQCPISGYGGFETQPVCSDWSH